MNVLSIKNELMLRRYPKINSQNFQEFFQSARDKGLFECKMMPRTKRLVVNYKDNTGNFLKNFLISPDGKLLQTISNMSSSNNKVYNIERTIDGLSVLGRKIKQTVDGINISERLIKNLSPKTHYDAIIGNGKKIIQKSLSFFSSDDKLQKAKVFRYNQGILDSYYRGSDGNIKIEVMNLAKD